MKIAWYSSVPEIVLSPHELTFLLNAGCNSESRRHTPRQAPS
jgi:hypothetical protein